MTYLEIYNALLAINQNICDECKARLDAITKENSTERKAVQLEYAMYKFCNASGLFNAFQTQQALQKQPHSLVYDKLLPKYPKMNSLYETLDTEKKWCFIAALHPELFIRDQWVNKKEAELAAATGAGDAKSVFELTIQLGAVKNMFAAWEQWRVENNMFPHMFEGDSE